MIKNIIILGTSPSSLSVFRGDLIKSLSKKNNVICIASYATKKEISKIQSLGCSYFNVNVKRSGFNLIHDLIYLITLFNFFKKTKPDILISYTIKPNIWGGIASRLAGVKHYYPMITGLGFAFQRNSFLRRFLSLVIILLYKIALKEASKVIFQNKDNLSYFINEGIVLKTNCANINGSGVNLNEFKPFKISSKKRFLLIARLLKAKGIREYVKAARIVRNKYPDAIFELVGPEDPSPDRIDIDDINRWVEDGDIVYSGETSDVRPFIEKCSVYVLPSYHEGMPRTVLEAMAMSRPILTTNVPGCRETVVEGENGWLVEKYDEQALADRMIWFIENEDEARTMGEKSYEIVCKNFNVDEVNKKIFKIIGIID